MIRRHGRKVQIKYPPKIINRADLALEKQALKSKSFCFMVDVLGIPRVMRLRGMSRRRVQITYINEQSGVERKKKPRKPKPNRASSS